MKNFYIFLSLFMLLFSCTTEKTNYYKNLDSGEVYNETEFVNFEISLKEKYKNDSLPVQTVFYYKKSYQAYDSLIQPFGLSVRVGEKYVITFSENRGIYSLLEQKLPEFELKTFDHQTITSQSLTGKPTLLNFWFIDCPPCISEMPELNILREKFKNDVNFIAITFESKDEVQEFLTKKEFDFIHIVDAQNFLDTLGVKAFPKNVFIDRNLNIRYIESGLDTNHFMYENHLNEMLKSDVK